LKCAAEIVNIISDLYSAQIEAIVNLTT